MKRYRLKVLGTNGEVLHDTVKVYKSKNPGTLHDRLARNMMRKYHGQWKQIATMLVD